MVYPAFKNLSLLDGAYHFQNLNISSLALSRSESGQLFTSERQNQQLVLSNVLNHTESKYQVMLQEIGHNVSHGKNSKNQRWYPNRSVVQKSSAVLKLREREKRWHKMQKFHAQNRGAGISTGLLQLLGLQLPHVLNVYERGFPHWHNTSLVESHLATLQKAVQHTQRTSLERVVPFSLNPDIVLRGEVSYFLFYVNSIINLWCACTARVTVCVCVCLLPRFL